jgi:hypothetical protein
MVTNFSFFFSFNLLRGAEGNKGIKMKLTKILKKTDVVKMGGLS